MKSVLLLLCCHYLAFNLSALSFDVTFSGQIQDGTGTFTFANDPGLGEFPLSTQDFALGFDLGIYGTFSETDILNLSTAKVLLTESGGLRRLQFTGDGGPNFTSSLELSNGPFYLAFEPSSFGGSLDQYFVADLSETPIDGGIYLAYAAPDAGSTALLLGISIPFLAFISRHARGARGRNV